MLVATAAAAVAGGEPTEPRLLIQRGPAVVRVVPSGTGARRLIRGADARWSPDGTQLVFSDGGDLWSANADGSGRRRLTRTPRVAESTPDWSPDGRAVVFAATQSLPRIYIVGSRGGTSRLIGPAGADDPTFSPDGRRLAFLVRTETGPVVMTSRSNGSGVAQLAALAAPDGSAATDASGLRWSPDGRALAIAVRDATGSRLAIVASVAGTPPVFVPAPSAAITDPVWSPDGTQLAFAALAADGSTQTLVSSLDGSTARVVTAGRPLDWQRVPLGRPRFPDLVQRPPSGLVVSSYGRGHWRLGFTSLVDNRGPGLLWLRAHRSLGRRAMEATQLVQLRGGRMRFVPDAGFLRYTVAPPHYHWHWVGFERFELRRAGDFKLVVRDHKSGFCIADHYGLAPGIRHGPPRFLGDCGQFDPRARSVEEGSSVGYTDRYPANFHGQNLDLKGVAPGRYWLVHRANSSFQLRERRYDNDVASLLLRISWPNGRRSAPTVTTLRSCRKERC
jgi:Lysyl oxidase/WD40-like Beta Propeller Repeat